jgi:hypothetical protein
MSKKKESNPQPPQGMERPAPPPAPPVAPSLPNPRATAEPVYDFSHGRRCPACHGTDTFATSTQGGIQYRTCRRVGCRYYGKSYPVVGKPL